MEISKEFKDLSIYYVKKKDIDNIIETVSKDLSYEAAISLMNTKTNDSVNYGNGFNKSVLRGSDVLIDKDVNGEYVYAIQIELGFMDKEIKKVGAYCWGRL